MKNIEYLKTLNCEQFANWIKDFNLCNICKFNNSIKCLNTQCESVLNTNIIKEWLENGNE